LHLIYLKKIQYSSQKKSNKGDNHERRVNGKTLTDEEMIKHYTNLVKQYNADGRLNAKWVYGLVVINEAITKEKDVHGLIIHSDQGFQYTSYEYKAICESNGIQISMSRKGTPIDDFPIESLHAILKKEPCTTIILHLYKNIFNL